MMRTTKELHIDIETYSDINLKKCGVYKYVDSSEFEILLLAYAFDNEPIQIIDFALGEVAPVKLLRALTDQNIVKLAHNANFERTCIGSYLKTYMKPDQWKCSAIRALTLGLPRSLEQVGEALELSKEQRKNTAGTGLINKFCKPTKKTKPNLFDKGASRNLPEDNMEDWQLFKDYCKQDVATERTIWNMLKEEPATIEIEQELWELDQMINEKGVLIDQQMIETIIAYNEIYQMELMDKAKKISGLENPRSVAQIKGWLEERDITIDSLGKEQVNELLDSGDMSNTVTQLLMIRQELGKTSVSKYEAMQRSVCSDGRVHGMLQFYGASRTGRWAGRIVQLQNLPRNILKDIDLAREIVKDNDFDLLEMLYGTPMEVLSQLIRTAFIAEDNKTFIVADYSAIEARVIAWLAGETWREQVFASHGKIYEASASAMFGVPIEQITKDSPLRAKGKVAELALGYQGAAGALTRMGAKDMGLSDDEIVQLVITWRNANINIVDYWYKVEEIAIEAILNPGITLPITKGVYMKMMKDTLYIGLPSGRKLAYKGAKVIRNKGRHEIRYIGSDKDKGEWLKVDTYGGKLAENITQAIARDCLGWAMLELNKAGYLPSFHVHDEVVIEVPEQEKDQHRAKISEIMALKDLAWTAGLNLTAAAYDTKYYIKD